MVYGRTSERKRTGNKNRIILCAVCEPTLSQLLIYNHS